MREIIKKYPVYPFEELSEKAQERAIQNLYYINVDYAWWELIYEDAERVHLKIKELDIDRGSYVKAEFITSAPECAEKIIVEHGKKCETSSTAKNYLKELQGLDNKYPYDNIDERPQAYDDERESLDDEFLKSLCEDYRIMLRNEFDYQTSHEAIVETIKANEYEFTEEGELI